MSSLEGRLCFKLSKEKRTQCIPGFFNPNQKVHGLFHFYKAFLYETIQNQLKKPSDIGLPKQQSSKNRFSIVKFACLWYFLASLQ